jgi:hypothetical protein
MIRAMTALAHGFLLEGVAFGEDEFWCCFGGVWFAATRIKSL